MRVLGLSAFYHDSAAALVVDGEIVAAAQEERFTRIKHDHNFPNHAVAYCLDEGRLTVNDIDYVVFYDKPLLKFDRLLETYVEFAPQGLRSFMMAMPLWLKTKLHLPREIRRSLGGGYTKELFSGGDAGDGGFLQVRAGYHFLRFAALEAQFEYSPKFNGKSGQWNGVATQNNRVEFHVIPGA